MDFNSSFCNDFPVPTSAEPTLLRKLFFFNVLRFFWTAEAFIPIFSASSVFEID